MSSDMLAIAGIALACSGAVGLLGLLALWTWRQASIARVVPAVAAVAVLATVAGVVGTARAMFLSSHDLRVTLVVCGVAGVMGLGLGLLLGRRVVDGTRALATAARDLGDGRPLTLRTVPATAELATVGRELERAAARLAEAHERERMSEASRRELVAWVSHDLRSPLAGLRAMAEALEDGVADDPARYHRQIRVEVDRLSGLVDDLFELSRIQAGTLDLALELVRLDDLVSDALAGADPLARARGVRLAGRASGPQGVRGDARRLSRVLANLVTNAVRHTPADGTVEVVADREGSSALLAVSDGCGGIPENDLRRVFDVGWRGSDARTPGPDGGAGLGLAIVRGLVEAHDGSVRVVNTDTGCRFEVRLPLAPAPAGQA